MKKMFKKHAWFYYFHERMNMGKSIHNFTGDFSDSSDTGSSSLVSNNDDILIRFRNQIWASFI